MAALSTTNPTLLDFAKAEDPDGKIATIVEIMNETNEILDDMTFTEGNLATGHRTTLRTGIPAPTWRKFNQGVQPTKGSTRQVTFNCGMLEAYAEVDAAMADLNGNTAAFRLIENRAHIEGISQEMANTLFYGDEASEPEAFTGLSYYYSDTTADNGENIVLGGGAGSDNASIWLIVWAQHTCSGIIPKGSTAGLKMTNKGLVTIENADGSNGRMEAYRTHYRQDAGLAVKDWRYAVRIPNIDKSALSTTWNAGAFSSGADLSDLMFQAMEKIPNLSAGRAVFYMSRDIRTKLRQQMAAKTQNSTLQMENVGGKRVMMFNEVPVKRCDALAADETLVS